MNERGDNPSRSTTNGGVESDDPPEATVRSTGWRGWIWAVPIAALMLVAYLAVRTWVLAGPTVTVVFPDAGGIGPEGTPVKHKGVQVGSVERVRLSDDLGRVIVRVSIDRGASDHLREGARFWIVRPGLGGGGGIKGMLAGSYIAMDPGDGEPRERFEGSMWEPVRGGVEFTLAPPGPAGDLEAGAAVRFKGRVVGRVREVGLEVDPANGAARTPVRIALDPTRFGLEPGDAERVRALLATLVENGLRARVQATGLILGGKEVALALVDGAPPGELDLAGAPPELPTAPARSIDAAIASVDRLIEKLGALPIDRIASNVRSFTDRVDKLAASPELERAIADMRASMERIKAIADSARGNVEPILRSAKRTAESVESAADAIARLSGASPREQQDLEELVAELIRMVESVRTLTDYLTRHPEAILQGRPGE